MTPVARPSRHYKESFARMVVIFEMPLDGRGDTH